MPSAYFSADALVNSLGRPFCGCPLAILFTVVRLLLVQFSEASSSPVSEVHSVVSSTPMACPLYWDPFEDAWSLIPSATFSWPRGKLRKCRLLPRLPSLPVLCSSFLQTASHPQSSKEREPLVSLFMYTPKVLETLVNMLGFLQSLSQG